MNFIPTQDETRLRAAASGVLPNGRPVVVNADGTVSVAGESTSSATQAVGTAAEFDGGIGGNYIALAFDTNAERIVVFFQDTGNSNHGTARVGTVSADNNNISWGTAVVVNSGTTDYVNITYDSTSQKVVLNYRDSGNSHYGTAIVGTVNPSDNSISFGSETVYNSNNTTHQSAAYDAGANKHVIFYRNHGDSQKGYSIVGTVSGTSISFGSAVKFYDSDVGILGPKNAIYDPSSQKCVITFRTNSDEHGTCMLATVSGTSVSFAGGSEGFKFESNAMGDAALAYDIINEKVVISYYLSAAKGKAVVATTSSTSISYGTPVVFADAYTANTCITYDANARRHVIFFRDPSDSNRGKVIVGTVSGTGISFSGYTETQFESGTTDLIVCDYDSVNQRPVVAFKDSSDGNKGKYVVFRTGYSNTLTNLTAENFLGFTGGEVTYDIVSQALGSATVFNSAISYESAATFDSNSNRIVIAYRNDGNSGRGTAIVGTVSGTSISFGTPVIFNSAGSQEFNVITFDSNSNKVVIASRDVGSANKGKAYVGTVDPSDNSISFGTEEQFNSSNEALSMTFDSNSNKVVITYRDNDNNSHGTAIVGTVSGTNISFGSEVVFNAASTTKTNCVFDSNSNKIIVSYNQNGLTARVGTVSGTGISFGTAVNFESSTSTITSTGSTFDSTSNKVIIGYRDIGDSDKGKMVIGTVSGTDISFSDPIVFADAATDEVSLVYDVTAKKVVTTFKDSANSNHGTLITGSVSGSTISFGSETVFEAADTRDGNVTYDSNTDKVVISFRDNDNSNYGTAIVLQTGYDNSTRGQVASGSSASVDIIGTVSENQNALTAGQSYFVQTDGTIGLTAGSPSVFAGTAISATKLLVKT